MTGADSRWKGLAGVFTRAFTQNLGLKAVAAAIAVVLFLVVRLQEQEERWIDVDVNVRRPPSSLGVALTSEMPESIRVLVRGRPSLVRSAQKGERQQVTVDLAGNDKVDSFYYYFEDDAFGFGSGIEVVDVEPQSILVRLERLVNKRLPVRVRTTGRVRAGVEFSGQVVVTPSELSVSGTASLVRALDEIETEEIDIEGLGVGEHVIEVPVRRREGVDVRHAADTVEVVFQVRWTPGQRLISGLPLRAEDGDLGAIEFQPAEVTVSLFGPQALLDKLDPAKLTPRAVIPEDAPRPGTLRLAVVIDGLGDQIVVKSIVPAKVQARFSAPPKPRKPGAEPDPP
jgi:hypothetical protein